MGVGGEVVPVSKPESGMSTLLHALSTTANGGSYSGLQKTFLLLRE